MIQTVPNIIPYWKSLVKTETRDLYLRIITHTSCHRLIVTSQRLSILEVVTHAVGIHIGTARSCSRRNKNSSGSWDKSTVSRAALKSSGQVNYKCKGGIQTGAPS